jgi:3',5'-cyclic AMP phosphodiesterase CpdA
MFRKISFLIPLAVCSLAAVLLLTPRITESKGGATPVRFAVIGDRTGGHAPGVYDEIIGEIELLKPDFVMNVGDMIEGYTDDYAKIEAEWDEYLDLLKQLSCPIHLTPGNHDIRDDRSREIYRKRIGDNFYSFDYSGLHFIILDVSLVERTEDFPPDQLGWLKNDLKKNRKAAQTFTTISALSTTASSTPASAVPVAEPNQCRMGCTITLPG